MTVTPFVIPNKELPSITFYTCEWQYSWIMDIMANDHNDNSSFEDRCVKKDRNKRYISYDMSEKS